MLQHFSKSPSERYFSSSTINLQNYFGSLVNYFLFFFIRLGERRFEIMNNYIFVLKYEPDSAQSDKKEPVSKDLVIMTKYIFFNQ